MIKCLLFSFVHLKMHLPNIISHFRAVTAFDNNFLEARMIELVRREQTAKSGEVELRHATRLGLITKLFLDFTNLHSTHANTHSV